MHELSAAAPDFGQPEFPALMALVGGLALTAVGIAVGADRETTQWYGFIGAFLGGSFGLFVYLFGLITNLY